MKKLLAIGLLTIGLASTTQQEAAAWCKWNFNIGLNMSYEGGNNRWLWGFINSGQVPGYPSDLTGGCHYGPQAYSSYPVPSAPCYAYAGAPAVSTHAQAPQPYVAPKTQTAQWYGNQAYQPAYYQYQAPTYPANPQFNPNYQFGHSQAPSYWYGY